MKRPPTPPHLAAKFFEWYCGSSQVEDLRGDIDELYYVNLTRMSVTKAKYKYWLQVISLLFSYALKKRKRKAAHHPLSGSNSFAMLKNYFIVATRNLAKQKFFTVINVAGLAIGMSFSLLLVALITNVYTYDTFHVNKDRIFRVISTASQSGVDEREYACAPVLLADGLKSGVSGIEKVVRIDRSLSAEAQNHSGTIKIPLDGYFVDPDFLQVFSFPMLKGNISTALQKPNSIVITEEAGKKMFGNDDPIGKVITIGSYGDCEVTGLLKDLPKNSHMSFEVLGSFSTIENRIAVPTEWKEFRGHYVYLLLSENASTGVVENYLARVSNSIYKDPEFKVSFELQSLNAIVPGPELWNQIGPNWDFTGMTVFLILTLLILLPACFNYANISIARALKRAKEIGLRKVVGGQRNQIFFQFLVETVIISLAALVCAYGLFTIMRGEFQSMMVAGDKLDLSTSLPMAIAFILFALMVGFFAGGIPALYFSRLNPIQALKSAVPTKSTRGFSFKKVMTVFQFALSLGFIMGVVIVFSQYRKALNYNFGFAQENVLNVELQQVKPELFKNEFDKLPAVQSVSMSSGVIGTYTSGSVYLGEQSKSDSIEVYQLFVDQNFVGNHNLKLIAGKNFVDHQAGMERQVIVNESFLKTFSTNAAQALGNTFNIHGYGDVVVLGVVADFHFQPLTEPIRSFFFRYDPTEFTIANLKVTSEDMATTFNQLEASWKVLEPETAFKSKFLDDEIQDVYSFYFSLIKVCGFLGILAISISCLGLLGMVVYTAESKTKEVGIRKVMGASSTQLVVLLSKGYINLVLIAAAIAIPAGYFIYGLMLQQIQQYAADIGVLEILISLAILLVLGVVTILSQTLRASRANPVDTLRYE